jgi:hypothetical protein
MKLAAIVTLGIVASLAGNARAQINLIDRPTPPPCCVDGVCHAHAARFGYFQTRWRVWPGLSVAPLPTVQPPTARPIPGVPVIEPIPPEQEDRQAPEPIKSSVPPPDVEPPAGAVPRTAPLESLDGRGTDQMQSAPQAPGPSFLQPPGGLQPQPGGVPQPGGFPQPMFLPRPSTTPAPTGGERSGAAVDRPPAPPIASNRGGIVGAAEAIGFTSTLRTVARPAAAPSIPPRQRITNDPPPAPPLALGGASL